MAILADSDGWSVELDVSYDGALRFHRLIRTYHLFDQQMPEIVFDIRFLWTIEGTVDFGIRNNLHVFLKPLPLAEEREALLGLYAGRWGGAVKVVAVPNVENDPLFLDAGLCMESDAAAICLKAFLVESSLTFSISIPSGREPYESPNTPTAPLFQVTLPNGPDFKKKYVEIRHQIERSQWVVKYRNTLKK